MLVINIVICKLYYSCSVIICYGYIPNTIRNRENFKATLVYTITTTNTFESSVHGPSVLGPSIHVSVNNITKSYNDVLVTRS